VTVIGWTNALLAVVCGVLFGVVNARGNNAKLAKANQYKWVPLTVLAMLGGVFLSFSVIGEFIAWAGGGFIGWVSGLVSGPTPAQIISAVLLIMAAIVLIDLFWDWKADGPTFSALAIGPTLALIATGTTIGDLWTRVATEVQTQGLGGLSALIGLS
jgi:hypothetical protein